MAVGRTRPTTGPPPAGDQLLQRLPGKTAHTLDAFDHLQRATVLPVVASSRSLSDAGSQRFAQSRQQRPPNNANCLRQYLLRVAATGRRCAAPARTGSHATF